MGGDDLGSDDDEYLNTSNLSPLLDADYNDEEEDHPEETTADPSKESNKRKGVVGPSSKKSKRKKKDWSSLLDGPSNNPKGRLNFLLEAGKDIVERNPEIQAAFMWTCYRHFLLASSKKQNVSSIETESIFEPSNFYCSGDGNQKRIDAFDNFVRGAVSSNKQLKKWKIQKSPMVLIVCVSARRAVAVLKSLSSLGVRAAKLFAKHMDLSEQIAMLSSNSYGIAVGTPNRLLKLCEGTHQGKSPFSLKSTELFIIDCHEDRKSFTVCTQNDTAPDLMELIQKAVKPQMKRKNPIKIALV